MISGILAMPADALATLVSVMKSSPATYIADSGIWSYPGDETLKLALSDVVSGQRGIVDRAAGILAEREVAAPQTAYPLSYTAWHDLDLVFLLPRVIDGMKRQVARLEQIVSSATTDQAAVDLGREAIAATRSHVDVLEQQAARLRHVPASA
jgi:hypothetical protein